MSETLRKKLLTFSEERRTAFAIAGLQYHADLEAEVKRLGKLVGDSGIATFAVRNARTVEDLKIAKAELQKRWDAVLPPRAQTVTNVKASFSDTDAPDKPMTEMEKALGITAADVKKYGDRGTTGEWPNV